MVEEAVSYNELDYISVSAAWVGGASLGVGPHPSGRRVLGAPWWGGFVGLSVPRERFDQ